MGLCCHGRDEATRWIFTASDSQQLPQHRRHAAVSIALGAERLRTTRLTWIGGKWTKIHPPGPIPRCEPSPTKLHSVKLISTSLGKFGHELKKKKKVERTILVLSHNHIPYF